MWISYDLMAGIALLLQISGLFIAVGIDAYILEKRRRVLFIALALELVLVLFDISMEGLRQTEGMQLALTFISATAYIIRPIIIVLFFYIVNPERSYKLFWILIGINAVIFLSAFFSPIAFWVGENNRYHRGPLGYSSHIVSGMALFYLAYLTIGDRRDFWKTKKWIPVLNICLIIVAVLLDTFIVHIQNALSFLTIAMVSGTLFYYIWLNQQLTLEHERVLNAEKQMQIMMSQIQPHFLYNTLATIQALCRTAPRKAEEVTERFGTYLRQNLDSLNQTTLVPIEKEIEHTRVYSEIEEVRFPKIQVTYDIEDADFSVPALTVQPLVENAIRHGVRGKSDGSVSVSTKAYPEYHEIIVKDNGKGFDADNMNQTDGTHIGLSNVKERIETMCRGTMDIDSTIGEGTEITIRIPEVG